MLKHSLLILFLIALIGCGKVEDKPVASRPSISPGPPQHWDLGDNLIKYPLPSDVEDIYVQLKQAPGFSFGMIRARKRLSARWHEDHEMLIYGYRGSARFHVADKDFYSSTGDIIYVPRGAVYSAESVRDQPFDFLVVYQPVFDGNDIFYQKPTDKQK